MNLALNNIQRLIYHKIQPTNHISVCKQATILQIEIITSNHPLAYWLECSPVVQETGVQSQVESYQRLKNSIRYHLA